MNSNCLKNRNVNFNFGIELLIITTVLGRSVPKYSTPAAD